MARVLVLGAGRQGRAAVYDLALDHDVVFADAEGRTLAEAASWLAGLRPDASVQYLRLDAGDPGSWPDLGRLDAVLNAASYTVSETLTDWACDRGRVGLVDLGGNPDVVAAQHRRHDRAVEAGASVVPDAGLAPGLAQVVAAYGLAANPGARIVSLYCGGLPPERPDHPWRHALFFAAEGLLNEYRGEETVLAGGELVSVPCLGGMETIEVPGVGVLEAAVTRGGVSTAPATFFGRLEGYGYKTLRWPGHWDEVRPWAEDGFLDGDWQGDAEGALRERLGGEVPTSEEDVVVLLAVVEGEGGRWSCLLVDRHDRVTGLSAMARTTGFPAAEVTRLAARRALPAGVLRHEADLPAKEILRSLERRGFRFAVEGP